MRVVAIVPARNEADRVGTTVATLLSLTAVDRVLVVDDGSGDDTASAAEGGGAEVMRLQPGVGKGEALEAGAATLAPDDVALLLDADLGLAAAEAAVLLAPVLAGDADMAVALFPRPAGKAGFGLVKGLARRGIARRTDGFLADAPLSGQRALSPAAVDAARPFSGGFGTEVTTTVRVLRAGLRVVEVPTKMAHRSTGRDLAGFAHRGRQYADVRRALRALDRESEGS
jgi:glycosyltransferase involved in cell wall biosynthesis